MYFVNCPHCKGLVTTPFPSFRQTQEFKKMMKYVTLVAEIAEEYRTGEMADVADLLKKAGEMSDEWDNPKQGGNND